MRLVLDFETTSTVDLRKTGVHAYAEHPDTQITVLCYAIDDGPVETWLSGPPPIPFLRALAGNATVVAHNYLFEWNVYAQKLVPQGWPVVPLSRWSCTMARALVAGYPASLDLVGEAAGLPIVKDRSAHDLMLRFARPRSLNPLTWWHETDPVRYKALQDYCARDVEVERLLDRKLPELSDRERVAFEIDHAINQAGIGIDLDLVDRLSKLTTQAQHELRDKIALLTGGQVRSLNQVHQLRLWLFDNHGLVLDNLRRATVQAELPHTSGPVRTVLQARLDASRSSTAKLGAIAASRSRDDRVRGAFQYYGASRTGRWAGRRVQFQNFFRGSIKDVPAALRTIFAGASPDDLDLLFEDSSLGVVASCLRSTIRAKPLHRLVVADFSQIEARVLAWLAGQNEAIRVFRQGKDIYSETAAAIGSSSRQLGKVLVLACGFGMAGAMFQKTAAGYGLTLSEVEAHEAVQAWRAINKRIEDHWWQLHRKLMDCVLLGPGAWDRYRHIEIIHRPRMLLLRLPSGRHLVYRDPKVQPGDKWDREFSYMGALGSTWTRLRTWPGKITENVTQAVARDVMVEAMLQLRDLPLIATVHDELIAEVPRDDADQVLDRMLTVMRQTPAWALGLPVDANGFVVSRYQKG